MVGAHYESVERTDFRLCTRCYQHEISTEQLTPGAHPMQRVTKDAHAQVRCGMNVRLLGVRVQGD